MITTHLPSIGHIRFREGRDVHAGGRQRGRLFRGRTRLVLFAVTLAMCGQARAQGELSLSGEEFARLDTFEGHSLARADKAFADRQYRQAVAEYDAFLLEFGRSTATPYAIYRKGRSLQLDLKRFEAIRAFTELLDYFPDDVHYAAAALFQIGQCHWDNGNVTEAMRAWAEMADDEDYRLHVFAAGAINRLADNLRQQDKHAEAVKYYWQVARDFRRTNGDAARHAIGCVVYHYIRRVPDQPKLREFYEEVAAFERNPGTPSDGNYWTRVVENVRRHSSFGNTGEEQQARARYFAYWAGQMEGKFAGWDDYQIARAEFLRHADGDTAKWVERLDKQFADHQKPGDNARVMRWMQMLAGQPGKALEYYGKLDFAKMSHDETVHLMRLCYDTLRDADMGLNVFNRINLATLDDNQRYHLARYFWHKSGEIVERICASMEDDVRGRMELLRYHHWRWTHGGQQNPKALELADEMAREPRTAPDAHWLKAEMLQHARRWPEAIAAYRASERLPGGPWRIVDCQLAAGQRDQALLTLREIENFFKDDAPRAALRIASVYRDGGDRARHVAALRAVLTKYPESGESRTAHLELEKLGITRLGGGVDAQ